MKKVCYFLVVFIAFFCLNGCKKDECNKTDAPEINFSLYVYGDVVVESLQTGNNITGDHTGLRIKVSAFKHYCNGTIRGPFDTDYSINTLGSLIKQSDGYFNFRMDNKEDYLRLGFFKDDVELGSAQLMYDSLKKYDGNDTNLRFLITIIWDTQNNKVSSATVEQI